MIKKDKMISERVLRKYRQKALKFKDDIKDMSPAHKPIIELCDNILLLTQELLDQHLLNKKS